MNILEQEDIIKGLPDSALQKEAQMPSGQVPQFLVISEIQRRTDMRKKFQNQQPQPQGTVAEQVVREGIMSATPQPPMSPPMSPPMTPQRMAYGGVTQMKAGGLTPEVKEQIDYAVANMPSDQAFTFFENTFPEGSEALNYALSSIDDRDIAIQTMFQLEPRSSQSYVDQIVSRYTDPSSYATSESPSGLEALGKDPSEGMKDSSGGISGILRRLSDGAKLYGPNYSMLASDYSMPSISMPSIDVSSKMDVRPSVVNSAQGSSKPEFVEVDGIKRQVLSDGSLAIMPAADTAPSLLEYYRAKMPTTDQPDATLTSLFASGEPSRFASESVGKAYEDVSDAALRDFYDSTLGGYLQYAAENFSENLEEKGIPAALGGGLRDSIPAAALASGEARRMIAREVPNIPGVRQAVEFGSEFGSELFGPSVEYFFGGEDEEMATAQPQVADSVAKPVIEPTGAGGAEVQGTSEIQTQAVSKAPSDAPIIASEDIADMVSDGATPPPPPPSRDFSDIMEQGRKEAMAQALIQLGSGIAGGDLAGGISRAGQAAYTVRQDARAAEAARLDKEFLRDIKQRQLTLMEERIDRDLSAREKVALNTALDNAVRIASESVPETVLDPQERRAMLDQLFRDAFQRMTAALGITPPKSYQNYLLSSLQSADADAQRRAQLEASGITLASQ